MKNISFVLLAACVVFVAGCRWIGIRGNGHIVTDQRTIGEFSEIHSSGAFDIEWRAGSPALSITTDENLLPEIESRKIDNYLELRTREQLRPTRHIKVVASSSQRMGAKLSGAGDLNVPALAGGKFAVQSSGAADITLEGTLDELLADMSGATDLKARGLQARVVQMSITGAGSAQVNAADILRVAITGAGDVTYFGNPKTVEKHITGAGSIRHKD
ncbi:MAG TPA: head GIN domain-containing protein [Candidatus Udaeobacter sp.]|jgi:hypothetical protein